MAVKRETPNATQVAWQRFSKLARQYREAVGDDELSALLIVRVRAAFETWVAAEEAAGKVK
jgi:hypothetical protein